MRLVDDDREGAGALVVADFVEDEGELLDRRDDDLLALLDEPAEVARPLGVPDGGLHLGVLSDRVADLPVQDAAVGDDDDRVEDVLAVPLERDQLVGQPGDREALPASRRMLDQVALSRAAPAGVLEQAAARHRAAGTGARSGPSPSARSSRSCARPPARSSPGCRPRSRGRAPRARGTRSGGRADWADCRPRPASPG